jgi:hypothetical protein
MDAPFAGKWARRVVGKQRFKESDLEASTGPEAAWDKAQRRLTAEALSNRGWH